jgi:polyhydroxybutyrate depolymerase
MLLPVQLAGSSGCSGYLEGGKVPGPGTHSFVLKSGEEQRSYLLHVPPDHDAKTRLPLVLVLHGRGGNGTIAELRYGFSALADQEGFVVVYPEASGHPPAWRPFLGRKDLAFLRSLIDTLQSTLAIDPRRIYVAGHSSGALMTYRLGAELSDEIAAIGIVAGSIGVESKDGALVRIPDPAGPVSVIAIHGKEDNHVPYDLEHRAKAKYPGFLPVAQSIEFWVENNGCDPTPRTEVIRHPDVVRQVYGGGKQGTEVVLYTIGGGNHLWPGAPRRAGMTPNQDISATEVIWDFFKKHPKPSARLSR